MAKEQVGGHVFGKELTRLTKYWKGKGYKVTKAKERGHVFSDTKAPKGYKVYISK